MVGYMRKNSKKVKILKSSLDHVISTKTKGTELIKVGLENILQER